MNVVELDIGLLGTRRDARKADETKVRVLMDSIADLGLINPIRVRPRRHYINGVEGDGYEVIAGAHRFRACLKLGVETVPCFVVDDDDLRAELAMIDENLCRAELSAADRAHQTKRRQIVYEELHPEAKAGAVSANARWHADENFAPAFTSDTAASTGRSARAVQLDAERGEKVCEEAINLIRGTDLDKGTYLDKLKKLEPEEQVATVNRALSSLARAVEREKAEAAEKRSKSRVEADVRHRAAQALAERIIANFPADELDAAKADAFACGATLLATALNNIAGSSIMDRAMGEAA